MLGTGTGEVEDLRNHGKVDYLLVHKHMEERWRILGDGWDYRGLSGSAGLQYAMQGRTCRGRIGRQ